LTYFDLSNQSVLKYTQVSWVYYGGIMIITKETTPLAEGLRPNDLSEIIGQQHLLGSGKPLRMILESGKLHSMILWGPPGVGKTSIARLTAKTLDCEWIALSAVFSGVKDIRAAIDLAEKHQSLGLKTRDGSNQVNTYPNFLSHF